MPEYDSRLSKFINTWPVLQNEREQEMLEWGEKGIKYHRNEQGYNIITQLGVYKFLAQNGFSKIVRSRNWLEDGYLENYES